MVTVDPMIVPTVADAERAAQALADTGAGCILLFGSVARGDAHRYSDLDLMVIYDDLDYYRRHEITARLARLASSTVECAVDIHVTDWPEWKMRTEKVRTSFESRVKRQGMVLVENQPAKVDWEKEMVMPRSDYEESVETIVPHGTCPRNLGSQLHALFLPAAVGGGGGRDARLRRV